MRMLFWLGLTGVVAGAGAVFYYSRPTTPVVEEEVAPPKRRMMAQTPPIAPPPTHLPETPRPFVPPIEPIVLRSETNPEPRPETLDILKQLNHIPGLPRVSTVASQAAPRPEDTGIQQVQMPYAPEDDARIKARREAQRQVVEWMQSMLAPVQQIPSPLRNWWASPDTAEESAEPPIAK